MGNPISRSRITDNKGLDRALFGNAPTQDEREFVVLNAGVIRAVCEVARGALGPNAMHKLFSPTGNITTDGLTLVREMKFRIDQPMVNILLKALESHDREAGDGTTRMLIFLGGLLEASDLLIKQGIHPSRIAEGYRDAVSDAITNLSAQSFRATKADYAKVAETALSGKASLAPCLSSELARGMERLAKFAGSGPMATRGAVAYEPLEASLPGQQAVFNGVILHVRRGHPSAPRRIINAKVAMIDYPLDVFYKPAYASRIPHGNVESTASVGEREEFSRRAREQLERLISIIGSSGADAVFCKRGMGNIAMSLLANRGIFPVEKIAREDHIRRLILATGANPVGNPSTISSKDLGKSKLIEEIATPSGHIVRVDGGPSSGTMTIFIRGTGTYAREAAKRGVETAVGAISSLIDCNRMVAGGGAAEAMASRHLSSTSLRFSSKKQLIYQGFSHALMAIPRNLAETARLDPTEAASRLSSSDDPYLGIDVQEKSICNTHGKGIVDPLKVVSCYISNATDFAALILGVDMMLRKPPERAADESISKHKNEELHRHSGEVLHPRYV
jgi:chaperonin GroEL (HSP60 family)